MGLGNRYPGSVEFVKPVRRKVKAREVLTGKRPVRA